MPRMIAMRRSAGDANIGIQTPSVVAESSRSHWSMVRLFNFFSPVSSVHKLGRTNAWSSCIILRRCTSMVPKNSWGGLFSFCCWSCVFSSQPACSSTATSTLFTEMIDSWVHERYRSITERSCASILCRCANRFRSSMISMILGTIIIDSECGTMHMRLTCSYSRRALYFTASLVAKIAPRRQSQAYTGERLFA